MHDPRTSTALRQLARLSDPPPPVRWRWTVARIDRAGRIPLPRHARTALSLPDGESGDASARVHRAGLVLTTDRGAGAPLTNDSRGRLAVPTSLRSTEGLVIGTQAGNALVVVAPVTILDSLGEVLAGQPHPSSTWTTPITRRSAASFDAGINLIDTARTYGTDEVLAERLLVNATR